MRKKIIKIKLESANLEAYITNLTEPGANYWNVRPYMREGEPLGECFAGFIIRRSTEKLISPQTGGSGKVETVYKQTMFWTEEGAAYTGQHKHFTKTPLDYHTIKALFSSGVISNETHAIYREMAKNGLEIIHVNASNNPVKLARKKFQPTINDIECGRERRVPLVHKRIPLHQAGNHLIDCSFLMEEQTSSIPLTKDEPQLVLAI